MSNLEAARWWSVRRAQSRKPATYTCPFCDERLPAFSEHVLVLPEGDAGRRRHAHTACAAAARKAGRLPSRDEWLSSLDAQTKPATGLGNRPRGEEAADTNGFAIASIFLGIIWLGGIGSILAIVLGYVGIRQIRASDGLEGGMAIAVAGVVIGVVGLLSLAVLVAFLISSAHDTPLLPGPSS